jgi:alcohol dehydrogenase
MLSEMTDFQVPRGPVAHFGPGTTSKVPGIVRQAGADAALVVTDAALTRTPVIPAVVAALETAGIPVSVFDGVPPNPTTGDIAAGADAVPALRGRGKVAIVAVGGGSPIDAAKGIALTAVNPQRGRGLDYRNDFAVPALPLIAVPATAGTGAETNAFGVVTDPATRRKSYVGHATTMPVAASLDPSLTLGLPAAGTAATGMDALTHATESYLSVRPNPYSAGVALQVIRMVAQYLPAAVTDGGDAEARSQMPLAAHMAGLAMAGTGLGIVHAIGHSLGGRWNIAHGVTLSMVIPGCLRFSLPARCRQLAEIAFALGAGDTSATDARNAEAAIEEITSLRAMPGMTSNLADYGIAEADYRLIAADALDDQVLANTPRLPTADDIARILAASTACGSTG